MTSATPRPPLPPPPPSSADSIVRAAHLAQDAQKRLVLLQEVHDVEEWRELMMQNVDGIDGVGIALGILALPLRGIAKILTRSNGTELIDAMQRVTIDATELRARQQRINQLQVQLSRTGWEMKPDDVRRQIRKRLLEDPDLVGLAGVHLDIGREKRFRETPFGFHLQERLKSTEMTVGDSVARFQMAVEPVLFEMNSPIAVEVGVERRGLSDPADINRMFRRLITDPKLDDLLGEVGRHFALRNTTEGGIGHVKPDVAPQFHPNNEGVQF